MIVLGINAFHGDSAACLVKDGVIVSPVEEERFRRLKHWAGLPSESIKRCLACNGLNLSDVDCIAINQDSSANMSSLFWYTLTNIPGPKLILEKIRTRGQRASISGNIAEAFPE